MKNAADWNEEIREAVRASGLSVYALARETGLKIAPLQRFMAGVNGVTVISAQAIGEVVGVELRRVRPRKVVR